MKKLFFTLLTIVAFQFAAEAQPPNPGGGGGTSTPNCFPPPCVPIDGGLSWLLLAGTVYGGKKLYKAKKEHHEEL